MSCLPTGGFIALGVVIICCAAIMALCIISQHQEIEDLYRELAENDGLVPYVRKKIERANKGK